MSPGKHFTVEEKDLDREDTLEMLKKGIAHAEIARQLGRSTQYIVNVKNDLVREGLITVEEIKEVRRKATEQRRTLKKSESIKKASAKEEQRNEKKAEVAECLNSGMTPLEISRKLGIAINTLKRYIAELVEEGRVIESDIISQKTKNKDESIKRNNAILEDVQTGQYTNDELAKKYNVSSSLISIIARGEYEKLITLSSKKPRKKKQFIPNPNAVLSEEERIVLEYLLKGQNYSFISKTIGKTQSEVVDITNMLKVKGAISSEQIRNARENKLRRDEEDVIRLLKRGYTQADIMVQKKDTINLSRMISKLKAELHRRK